MANVSLYEKGELEERRGESQGRGWGGGGINTTSDMLAVREFSHSLPPVFVERIMISLGRGS